MGKPATLGMVAYLFIVQTNQDSTGLWYSPQEYCHGPLKLWATICKDFFNTYFAQQEAQQSSAACC